MTNRDLFQKVRTADDLEAMNKIDTIIIGYNDIDFGDYAYLQEQVSSHFGTYSELKTNSILIDGRRETYMNLLNRILSIQTGSDWELNAFKMPNLAVAYLASYLKKRDFNIGIVNFFNSEKGKLAAMMHHGARSIVITTTYYVDDEPIKEIVKFARSVDPEVKIIVGGPRIFSITKSMSERRQDLTFRNIGADIYISSSEGEQTLAAVVEVLKSGSLKGLSDVNNLIYKVSERDYFARTEVKVEQNDLDSNAVQWELFEKDFFTPVTYMRTSRSCPFSCEFCSYPINGGAHITTSIEVIEGEMRKLHDAGVQYLIFIDDTFNVPLPRFKQLLQMMIKNQFNFKWISFFRCSNADDEAFDLMVESGCLGLYLGIESGDERILKNMHKFADVKRYRNSIKKLRDRNILTLASLIIGFPGETEESVQNTINFLNESPTTFYSVQLYFHDTLAPIEQKREAYGIKGRAYSWSHNTMDWKRAIELKEYMLKSVKSSLLIPLYGFSIWTLPYLLEHGLSVNNILEFVRFANSLLEDEMNGYAADIPERIREFSHNFRVDGQFPCRGYFGNKRFRQKNVLMDKM